jgi:MFS family permease
MCVKLKLSSLPRLGRDASLIIVASGISAVSFFGIQMLLKVLYILRLGHGPEYVGLFGAVSAFVYMAMGLPSGALGSRFGTRRIMLIGGFITMVGMALLPMTEWMPGWAQDAWPFVSQVVLTAGWSMFNVNMVPALMAGTTPDTRNGAYALGNAVRSMGTFVGTFVGGALPGAFGSVLNQALDAPAPYRYALWVGAALCMFSLIPLVMIGKVESHVSRQQAAGRGPFPVLPIGLMVGYVLIRHAGWATCQAFYNAYLDTDLHLSASSIGLITGIGQALSMVAALMTPRLAARRSNGWTLVMTTLGTAVFLLPLALVPHWTAAAVGRVGILIMSAVWMPALQVFQMELVDSQWRSLAYGAVAMAMGMGFGSTSFGGGYLVAAAGYRSLFLMGVALSVVAAAVMWGILRCQSSTATAEA